MCTAIAYQVKDRYFGRNLDLEYTFEEQVVVAPRRFTLPFRCMQPMQRHHAIIGMAHMEDGYPLFYDAVNEHGLCMAGLNFPSNAYYPPITQGRDNIAPFEFIPWVLAQCVTLDDVRKLLARICLADIAFSPQLPPSPLHWMIADANGSIVVESMRDGLHVHDDPVEVLTNNPPFDYHMTNLSNYMQLSAQEPQDRFAPGVQLKPYSRAMGAVGLPGDLSSSSRFVRAAFTLLNAVSDDDEASAVSQFMHILGAVSMTRGAVRLPDDHCELTQYTSCCNATRGIYYYTTYDNSRLTAVHLHGEDPEGDAVVAYPLRRQWDVFNQNDLRKSEVL